AGSCGRTRTNPADRDRWRDASGTMCGMLNFLRRGRGASNAASADTATEADPDERAAEFWRRWDELLPEITSALADGQPQRVETLVTDLVHRVHPNLICSLETGGNAAYALVVTGEGDPELRGYTDAWMRAAPAPDAAWEYHDSVPPVPDPTQVTVNVGEAPYTLSEVRVVAQVDEPAGVVDVALHHPGFAD